GGEPRAALVEHDAAHTLGQSGLDARRFRSHQLLGRLAIARLGLQRLQFEPALRRKTLGEIGIGRVGPGRLPLSDGREQQLQAARRVVFLAGAFFTPTVRVTAFLAGAFFAGALAGAFLAATVLAAGARFTATFFAAGAGAEAFGSGITAPPSTFILTALPPQISSRW